MRAAGTRPTSGSAVAAMAVAMVVGQLVGCGRSGEPEADLIFAVTEEHVYLDPQKISWVSDGRIANCLFEPLVQYRVPSLELEGGAAERWELSDDGRTYTFHLRPEARWSNGDAVTAGDFVYAWRRALMPDSAADYSQLFFHIEGAEAFFNWRQRQLAGEAGLAGQDWQEHFARTVGIEAADDHTLVVRLRKPVPYFLELCAFVTFMPVHAASVQANTRLDQASGMVQVDPTYFNDPARLVTNGPYRLERRRFRRDLLMVQNAHYWNRDAMRNRSILEKIVSDQQTSLLMYNQGQVDWLPELASVTQAVADLAATQRRDVHVQSMAGVYFYNFNCLPKLPDGRDNPLADPRVRRALSMAIDRDLIVSQVTRLNQPTTRTFVPVDAVDGYLPPVEAGIGFDPVAAKALLAEAGYPDGSRLTGLSILYNTGFGHENIAQAIKRMWQEYLGVIVTLEGVEVKTFSSRLKKHEFTIARAAWFGDYRDPTTWLDKMATDNGNNDCAYSNARYDELLRQAEAERDPAARFELLRQAEAIMLQDSPMAMIFQYLQVYLWDPDKVDGLQTNPWNQWRLEFVQVNR